MIQACHYLLLVMHLQWVLGQSHVMNNGSQRPIAFA